MRVHEKWDPLVELVTFGGSCAKSMPYRNGGVSPPEFRVVSAKLQRALGNETSELWDGRRGGPSLITKTISRRGA